MPTTFSQANRPLAATTPLGPDVLLLTAFAGEEGVSRLFAFELEMVAEKRTTVAFDKLLGQSIGVAVVGADGAKRHFNGLCHRVSQGHSDGRFTSYRLFLAPKAWLLTRNARSRVFQALSVPDILKKVLTGFPVEWKLTGTYEPRDYCVQYRETDFEFASRLMEDEGIFYFFKHADGSHTMVVGDAPTAHPDVAGDKNVKFEHAAGGVRDDERVLAWQKAQEMRSGKFTLRDHHLEMPDNNFEASQPIADSVQIGTVTHKTKVGGNENLEIYDYPGGYAGRFDGIDKSGGAQASQLSKISGDATRTVKLRMQEEASPGIVVTGESNCTRFTAGQRFTLADHDSGKGDYVLTSVRHRIAARSEFATVGGGGEKFEPYSNEFTCIPAAHPFRPERTTPRAVVQGCQTALVVGPSGEEIFTDKYGRVRVQFPWDREGKKDGASTCWVRVGTHWAGKQWGAIHIPRIGQEVIVDFLEGDPDQPIVVGSVYNAEQMPPYALPDNKTQSGLKSRSSPQGAAENFNELRFEDKKDAEEIYFHAEKDFNRVVENNDTLKVGSDKAADGSQTIEIWKDRTETVKEGNETVTIEKGNRTVTVAKGDELLEVSKGSRTVNVSEGDELLDVSKGKRTVTVGEGDDLHQVKKGKRTVLVDTGDDVHTIAKGARTVEVSTGNDTLKVAKGNRTIEVSLGNDELTIKAGNQTTKLDAGKCGIEAMQGIELKVAGNSIKIDPSGITIKGIMVKIEADAMFSAKGAMAEVKGDAMLTVKGAITMIG
jgi:type VI secretion system secreted protein VgrG